MFEQMQRRLNGVRARFAPAKPADITLPSHLRLGGGAPQATPEATAPEPGIPLQHDVLAGLLAEDARNSRREWRLGVIAAGCWCAALFTGVAIPALAVAFTLAPVVALAMELLARDET
jgi:hypothetical protein